MVKFLKSLLHDIFKADKKTIMEIFYKVKFSSTVPKTKKGNMVMKLVCPISYMQQGVVSSQTIN